jgi:DNA-directed RNA polymerase subunit RPC12/RpoP
MSLQIAASPEGVPTRHSKRDEYFCPVCGIDLAPTDFDTPERDYYCPFCSTRQRPAVV